MALRDYQVKAWNGILSSFKNGKKSVVVTLPTGTGKGTLEAEFSVFLSKAGKRIIITTPRQEICLDVADRVKQAGGEVGIIAPWAKYEPEKLIQIAMAPTLANRYDKIEEPDVLIIDECHHSPATGYIKFINEWKDARRVGLTATLWRLDGQGFDAIFDEHIEGEYIQWFVDNGYLTDVDVYAPFIPEMGPRRSGGDYTTSRMEEALENSSIFGDAVKAFKTKVRPGGTAVAFCCSKKHAQLTADIFNAAGIPAEVLLGEHQGDVRKGIIGRLSKGITHVVCAVDVISEGFDLPSIDAVILMRPTQSLSLYLQQVGRVLRTIFAAGFDLSTKIGRLNAIAAGPKPRAIVIDCAGNFDRHGHPLNDRDFSLSPPEAVGLSTTHTKDGSDLSTRRCEECLQVMMAPVSLCPYCGHENGKDPRVPAKVEAELRLVQKKKIEKEKRVYQKDVAKEKYFDDMMKVMRFSASVKNPRHAAKNRLIGRAKKYIKEGDFIRAKFIGLDLANNGFKEDKAFLAFREDFIEERRKDHG